MYYPISLHLQEAYREGSSYKEGDFPVSESLSERALSLPMHTELTAEVQDQIIRAVKDAVHAREQNKHL